MLQWNILEWLTKMLRQYLDSNEWLEIFVTCFCNILCYVGNFTGPTILRIFRWKLWVTLCSVPLLKLPFRLKEKFSVFRNFFDRWNFSIEDCLHKNIAKKLLINLLKNRPINNQVNFIFHLKLIRCFFRMILKIPFWRKNHDCHFKSVSLIIEKNVEYDVKFCYRNVSKVCTLPSIF